MLKLILSQGAIALLLMLVEVSSLSFSRQSAHLTSGAGSALEQAKGLRQQPASQANNINEHKFSAEKPKKATIDEMMDQEAEGNNAPAAMDADYDQVVSTAAIKKLFGTLTDDNKESVDVRVSSPVKTVRNLYELIREISWSMFQEVYQESNEKERLTLRKFRTEAEEGRLPFLGYL